MKAWDFLFAAMFAISAALQINDPDPTYWVLVYGLSALVPFMHSMGRHAPFLAALALGMIISGMIYATPGFIKFIQAGEFASIVGSMDGAANYVEPAREFLGLLIALAIVGYYAAGWRRA